jgi:hypothetical protein
MTNLPTSTRLAWTQPVSQRAGPQPGPSRRPVGAAVIAIESTRQLIERIAWAAADAEALESPTVTREPDAEILACACDFEDQASVNNSRR